MEKSPNRGTVTGRFPNTVHTSNEPKGLAAPIEPLDEAEAKINGALPMDALDELNDDSLGLSLPGD